MLHRSFKPAKCKTALKLATSRIKLMKNKKENHLKQLKRELAQLLESGQDQTARIRVEHAVREEKTIAAYDLIDIYCELIVARLPIIESQKNCPIDLKEAVTSVVFASPRCSDIPELQDVRKHFTAKYGKEFVTAALELRPECGVSRMLVDKLSANAPDGQTKLKILTAIAEEHNVEWDPKSFGAKESKPYDDLLKGPNAFHEASKMHSEPPIVQAPPPPSVHSSQGRDQRHDAPVDYQQNLHSPSSPNFPSSDLSSSQAPSAAPYHPPRPSGPEYERTEIRHSHLQEENAYRPYPLGRQNGNMEFKDATAAAQAAAESAERASMAARAAVALSTRENITRQHPHKSNADDSSDDKSRKNNDSPSKFFVKDTDYNLPQDRNQKPSMRTEKVDGYKHENYYDDDERHYKDDHNSAKRFNQSASSKSGTASVSVKDKRPVNNFHDKSHDDPDERFYMDDVSTAKRFSQSTSSKSGIASVSIDDKRLVNIHGLDRYSRKSSFEEEVVKLENSASLSDSRVNKQSSGEDRNSYYHSSSSDNGDDYIKSSSHQNFVFDNSKDPFDHEKSRRDPAENSHIGTVEAVFDSYVSEDDIIKFDKHPQYVDPVSSFYSASITKEPSNHFAGNIEKRSSWEDTSGLLKKLSASRVSAELFSPSQFDESSPKVEDLAPATFDDSRGPSSDSEDELEKSSFHGKFDPSIQSYKDTDFFRNSNDLSEDHGSQGSYFTVENDLGSKRKQNLLYSSDDREYTEVAGQNKHKEEFSSQSRTRFDYDDMSSSLSPAHRNSKVSSNEITHGLSPQSSRRSSVNELKHTDDLSIDTMKNEVFNQSSSESGKELKFTTLTGGLRNKGYMAPPYAKSASGSSLSSKRVTEDTPTYTQNPPASPGVDSSSLSSRVGPKVEVNPSSTTRFKKYDLGTDDIEEKLPQQNLQSKREHRKESLISRTRVNNYDLGIDEFEEELPEPKLTNKQERREDYTKSKENSQSKREYTKDNSLSRTRVKNNDMGTGEFEEELPKAKLANKQERTEGYAKSKFSAPAGFFDSDENDSNEDLPKRPSTIKVRAERGFSRRTKANPNSETSFSLKIKRESPASVNSNSVSENKHGVSENRPKPMPKSEKHSITRQVSEEKQKPMIMEQPSSPLKNATSSGTETSRTSSGEAPSRESSLKKASHVHPKLPDYDSFAAHFQSLRQNHS